MRIDCLWWKFGLQRPRFGHRYAGPKIPENQANNTSIRLFPYLLQTSEPLRLGFISTPKEEMENPRTLLHLGGGCSIYYSQPIALCHLWSFWTDAQWSTWKKTFCNLAPFLNLQFYSWLIKDGVICLQTFIVATKKKLYVRGLGRKWLGYCGELCSQ